MKLKWNKKRARNRVLHLEMPRSFTTTLQMFDARSAVQFDAHSVVFDQADINTHFWQYVMSFVSPELQIDRFFDKALLPELLNDFCFFLGEFSKYYGVPLTPFGFEFDEIAHSSAKIIDAARNPALQIFADEYIENLSPNLKINDPNLKIVSLGVDSANSLIFACIFAKMLRDHLPDDTKIILGKSSYENFSLALRKKDLIKNKHLENYFDRVIFHEEMFVKEILQLLSVDETDAVSSDAISPGKVLNLIRESVFLDLLSLPLSRYVCSMPLSRNKCYWNKCSFCVQVKKHLRSFSYEEPFELQSAMAELVALDKCGFKYFLFNDEAVQPARLRRFCELLEESPVNIRWTPRIIADANFKEELIRRMAKNGCIEVLFGLETVSTRTATAMKKVSHKKSEEQLLDMLIRFNRNNINIFLNLIYAFPTESDEEFEATYRFSQQVKKHIPQISVQFNKFALFYGSDIFHSPGDFGVEILEEPSTLNDIKIIFPYRDCFERSSTAEPNMRYFAESLDMNETQLEALKQRKGSLFIYTLYQLNYASFGMINKDNNNENLFRDVI